MSSPAVSGKLAEYMLKGWILTDEMCANDGCSVPLMRSPKGLSSTKFCARCNEDPEGTASSSAITHALATHQASPTLTPSTGTRLSGSSTPPTDISSALSSPTFASPIDTAETLRRRQQSDAASAEIGKRLLKGWAMLADECPNTRCYGVPLVRPPVAGGGKDPRKECVICGTVYVDEKDVLGWDRLVPVSRPESSRGGMNNAGPSNVEPATAALNILASSSEGVTTRPDNKSNDSRLLGSVRPIANSDVAQRNGTNLVNESVLESAKISLETALDSLSQRLLAQTSNPLSADPHALSSTAEAMAKVLQVLVQTQRLQASTRIDE